MPISGKRLHGIEESGDALGEFSKRRAAMVSGDRIVHGFPKPLDLVHPRRVGGLEQQPNLGVAGQPAMYGVTLVDDVVIENEHETASAAVGSAHCLEQLDDQCGVLPRVVHPHEPSGVRVQRAGQVVLDVLPRRRDADLLSAARPRRTDARGENR